MQAKTKSGSRWLRLLANHVFRVPFNIQYCGRRTNKHISIVSCTLSVIVFHGPDTDIKREKEREERGQGERERQQKTKRPETINEPSKPSSCGNRVPFAPLKMYMELMARTERPSPMNSATRQLFFVFFSLHYEQSKHYVFSIGTDVRTFCPESVYARNNKIIITIVMLSTRIIFAVHEQPLFMRRRNIPLIKN